jgi:metal-sulfur cluster biosynthetic enzyme
MVRSSPQATGTREKSRTYACRSLRVTALPFVICRLAATSSWFLRRKSDMGQDMRRESGRELDEDPEALMNIVSATPVTADDEQMSFAADRSSMTDAVVAALRAVQDPEIPVNIYDLGLIYKIELGGEGFVAIDMTLTAPGARGRVGRQCEGESRLRSALGQVADVGGRQTGTGLDVDRSPRRSGPERRIEFKRAVRLLSSSCRAAWSCSLWGSRGAAARGIRSSMRGRAP